MASSATGLEVVTMRILDYLSAEQVDFEVRHHRTRYTALEEAAAEHLSGRMFAKTVVVSVDGEYVMLVLPASCRVDLGRVSALLDGEARMATESELAELFADCELGAEPPFGSRYGLRTLVDEHLAGQLAIAFRAGSHREVVILRWDDYARLEWPRVCAIALGEGVMV